jgi:hypothetical protein
VTDGCVFYKQKGSTVSDPSSSSSSSGGIGFFGLLAIVFITLKLCHVIDWSWWLVLAPIWGPIAVVLLICGVVLLAMFIADATR